MFYRVLYKLFGLNVDDAERKSQSHPLRVKGFITVPQIARKINMPVHWIYDRIHNGTINTSKDSEGHIFIF